eukprot:TRINITY_DN4515_c0_g1_i3.p1 TRINITY_DN4515_c0_g1~~TRINITY_DN4515_c0_g1_i3.p1  ORF type:complete len:346 (-),score=95.08 TRINITY_DN4515_c0_g1_i3:429-1466(-)
MDPMKTTMLTLLFLSACIESEASRLHPQYVVMHQAPGQSWDQDNPAGITQSLIDNVLKTIGTKGSDRRSLGFSFSLSYLESSDAVLVDDIERLLNLSLANELPVMIILDGFEWWNSRTDLYNWWDASSPGYNATNVNNVEWTGWTAQDAVKIGWRNWGSQIRVPAPHPNIASPAFIDANLQKLQALVPVVAKWYAMLPAQLKYLLVGIKAGWELQIGSNYYYYPDGNALIDQNPANDPVGGVNSSVQVGYAAVKTLGLAQSGELTIELLNGVVSNYVALLTDTIRSRSLGIPHSKIFTHVGANGGDLPAHLVWADARCRHQQLAARLQRLQVRLRSGGCQPGPRP